MCVCAQPFRAECAEERMLLLAEARRAAGVLDYVIILSHPAKRWATELGVWVGGKSGDCEELGACL